MEKLTQEYLKRILHYDPLTGIFTWLERPVDMFFHCKNPDRACNTWNTRYANKVAGTVWTAEKGKTSYIVINIKSNEKTKNYRAHRLAILYTDGHLSPKDVDHIDGNGLSNARINLREVNALENHKNYPMYSNNTSGQIGVYWNKAAQKWHTRIKVNGKYIHGGLFISKKNAIAKRRQMEIEHGFHKNHGRKCKKNSQQ